MKEDIFRFGSVVNTDKIGDYIQMAGVSLGITRPLYLFFDYSMAQVYILSWKKYEKTLRRFFMKKIFLSFQFYIEQGNLLVVYNV